MNNILEQLQREIDQLKRQVEAFQSGGYATLQWTYLEGIGGTTLTSTSYDGDETFSTAAKANIDLSAVFGAPAGLKAILVRAAVIDSGSAGTDCRIYLGPSDTAYGGTAFNAEPINSRPGRSTQVVVCDSGGNIYIQTVASGAGTMSLYLSIIGYAL